MVANATSSLKYIVLITDNDYHDAIVRGGSIYTTTGIANELGNTGCPVFISLWDSYWDYRYSPLLANGGQFDLPNMSGDDTPGNWKYPLTNLRYKILSDL